MSGGSFDYLCQKEFEHFVSYQVDPENVELMASTLENLGFETLAKETRALLEETRNLREQFEQRFRRISRAWHDVEWWQSCDYSKEQALIGCAKVAEELREIERQKAAEMRDLAERGRS